MNEPFTRNEPDSTWILAQLRNLINIIKDTPSSEAWVDWGARSPAGTSEWGVKLLLHLLGRDPWQVRAGAHRQV